MPNILIRAAKQPWDPTSAEETLRKGTIATNVGNLLFSQSVYRTLDTPTSNITPDNYTSHRYGTDDKYVEMVNANYDHFVLPLANAFRPDFKPQLDRLTHLIERLDIPVTVVGVGSQHKLDAEIDTADTLAEDVKKFMSVVLERSASIGVRGELTANYLKELGFGNEHVDVIGCPSLFMHGPHPAVKRATDALNQDSRIALSISPYVDQMRAVVEHHVNAYPNLIYIPQNATDLAMMVWGEERDAPSDLRIPTHMEHPLYLDDRMRFPLDPKTWVNYLTGFDFSFGTRIHGTVAGILAGIPTMLLAHDSRTLELAEYHAIPHRRVNEIPADIDAAELFNETNYDQFHARLPETFDRFTSFLAKNGLDHTYQPGNGSTEFDDKLRAAKLPPMVHTLYAPGREGRREIVSRLRWLRQGQKADVTRTTYAVKNDVDYEPKRPATVAEVNKKATSAAKKADESGKKAETAAKDIKKLRSDLAGAQSALAKQQKMIDKLNQPKPALHVRARRYAGRVWRGIKRRLTRRK